MKKWYKGLKNRYHTYPSEFQILNMVSDLNKAKNLFPDHPDSAKNHILRAIILLDYIINDPKWKGKYKELLRLREVLGSILYAPHYATIDQVIKATLLLDCKAYKAVCLKAKESII